MHCSATGIQDQWKIAFLAGSCQHTHRGAAIINCLAFPPCHSLEGGTLMWETFWLWMLWVCLRESCFSGHLRCPCFIPEPQILASSPRLLYEIGGGYSAKRPDCSMYHRRASKVLFDTGNWIWIEDWGSYTAGAHTCSNWSTVLASSCLVPSHFSTWSEHAATCSISSEICFLSSSIIDHRCCLCSIIGVNVRHDLKQDSCRQTMRVTLLDVAYACESYLRGWFQLAKVSLWFFSLRWHSPFVQSQ